MLLLWCVLILIVKKGGWPCATKISMIVSCFHSCTIVLWKSLQLGKVSTMEGNTDWKSLRIFIFMDLKSPLNWLETKIKKIEENLNETVKHCLKQNVHKFLTKNNLYGLLFCVFAIGRSVLGGEKSVLEKSGRCRKVSAVKDVRYKVSLNFILNSKNVIIVLTLSDKHFFVRY